VGRIERVTWKIYIILGKIDSENLLCDRIEGMNEGRAITVKSSGFRQSGSFIMGNSILRGHTKF